jgi:hypothetical protein
MAVTDFLSAPTITKVPEGVDCLHRVWVLADSVAAPIVPRHALGVQNITTTPWTPQVTKDIYHQGGGDDNYYEHKSRYEYDFTVQMLSGDVEAFIADIKNVVMGTDYILPMQAHSDPLIHWEMIVRKGDGTHLFSKVYRDLILKEWAFNSPMEDEVVDIPFYSKRSPFTVYTGHELVVDRFTGDGSTTDMTLSATPITYSDVSTHKEYEDYYWDNFIDIVYKLSSEDFGTFMKTGFTNVTTTLTKTVAPAASSTVTVTYIKATA